MPDRKDQTELNLELLARITAINVDQGLKRVAGNPVLFLRLLPQFGKQHVNDISKLCGLLNEGNTQEAKRLVHTLKGVTVIGTRALGRIGDHLTPE